MLLLDVSVLSPKKVIFEGKARSVSVPGEQGVFEVFPFHKHILSRLVSGVLFIDTQKLHIQRGIIKVEHNRVTVIVEESL